MCKGGNEPVIRRECVKCWVWISKSNFARHARGCNTIGVSEGGAIENGGVAGKDPGEG